MAANHSIVVDPVRCIVRASLNGFFSSGDVAGFARDQRGAYAALAGRIGQHVTLVDVSECKIQPQDVVEAFRALLNDPALMSRRIAFVTGSSPARMQIRRLINRDSARFFDDIAAAEAWLAASPVVNRAPAPTATDAPARRARPGQ
jgi:hypothetical protein